MYYLCRSSIIEIFLCNLCDFQGMHHQLFYLFRALVHVCWLCDKASNACKLSALYLVNKTL